MDEDVGQGSAIQVVVKKCSRSSRDDVEEMSSSRPGIKWRNVGGIKDKLLEKLTAAAVPADAFDNARHFLETVVREVTLAAHGLTMDAFNRMKSHLSDFLPSLSPALASKMVEDEDQEAAKEEEEGHDDNDDRPQQKKKKTKGSSSERVSMGIIINLPRLCSQHHPCLLQWLNHGPGSRVYD